VLTADTALQVGTCCTALEHSLAYELANTVAVQDLERIVLEDVLLKVDRQELSDIVTRETESHLSKVVCTE
jgi:hypothetical protein